MRNHRDLRGRHAVDVTQHGGSALRHHNQFARALNQLTKNLTLFGIWIRQNGVQGHNRGHFSPPEERQDVTTRLAAENSKFMLNTKHINMSQIQKVSRPQVGRDIVLLNFKAHLTRVFVSATGIGHRDHRAVPIRARRRYGIAKITGESRNSTLSRRIVSQDRDLAAYSNLFHVSHHSKTNIRIMNQPLTWGLVPTRQKTIPPTSGSPPNTVFFTPSDGPNPHKPRLKDHKKLGPKIAVDTP